MGNESIIQFRQVDPHGDAAVRLTGALAAEEADLYHDLGPDPFDSFRPEDAAAGGGAFVIAFLDGQPVGCGAVRPSGNGVVEINRIYVNPTMRRRGVGRALLGELERLAALHGNHLIRLETGNRQAAAIALYESCGFHRTTPFGSHRHDPVSVFFAKSLDTEH